MSISEEVDGEWKILEMPTEGALVVAAHKAWIPEYRPEYQKGVRYYVEKANRMADRGQKERAKGFSGVLINFHCFSYEYVWFSLIRNACPAEKEGNKKLPDVQQPVAQITFDIIP